MNTDWKKVADEHKRRVVSGPPLNTPMTAAEARSYYVCGHPIIIGDPDEDGYVMVDVDDEQNCGDDDTDLTRRVYISRDELMRFALSIFRKYQPEFGSNAATGTSNPVEVTVTTTHKLATERTR